MKWFGQRQYVLAALAERRHLQLEGAEPVIEVGPEPALARHLGQVAVRRRHDAHIAGEILGAADAPELLGLDDAQKLGLGRGRDFADLVQKQRAPVGGLDEPALQGVARR